ncbi:MAG: FdrA family protein [Acidimicrobiales bacterium]
MSRSVEVRAGRYHDSVTLMLLSETLGHDPAVAHALVAMATGLNLELLADAGYQVPGAGAGDLVIAVHLVDGLGDADGELERLRTLADGLLSRSQADAARGTGGSAGQDPPRSVTSAAARSGATVALISVPGAHAFRTAMEAIEAGLHPVIFSDNVSVDHEVAIKEAANAAGLVAMGPDCGTVILDGVGLGFANAVVPGPIGLVSASGTGAQQVCALADQAGLGVRHVIGLGGRDLSDAVGGRSALPALRLLDADPAVEVIGIVAKEIGPATAARLDEVRATLATPSVLLGTDDLTATTAELLAVAGVEPPEPLHWDPAATRPADTRPAATRPADTRPADIGPADTPPEVARPAGEGGGRIVGLYGGGTLAAEAEAVLEAAGIGPERREIVDLGDDRYTQGRPHPMIDDRLRLDRLHQALADPDVAVVLLDVVLGHGCLADPAAGLAPVIAATDRPVHVAVVGTADDPQGRDSQAEALARAGASVWLSNSAAARAAAASAPAAADTREAR